MGKKTLGAQVDEDSGLYQRFEEFEEEFETRSEAVRAAIRRGVTADDDQEDEKDTGRPTLKELLAKPRTMMTAGVFLFVGISLVLMGASFLADGYVWWGGVLAILGFNTHILSGAVIIGGAYSAWQLDRPYRSLVLPKAGTESAGGGR
jgi:hypothetical protein